MGLYIIPSFLLITLANLAFSNILNYEDARREIIRAENMLATGGNLRLNSKEQQVDNLLLKYKLQELTDGFLDADRYAACRHFFQVKPLIENSKVFKFLQQMPKGAVLHVHSNAAVSSEWFIKNVTYMPGLWKCINKAGNAVLSFRKNPQRHECQTGYVSIADERNQATSREYYDGELEKLVNLYTPTPETDYPNINVVWSKFDRMFGSVSDAYNNLPVLRALYWQIMKEFYADNIMYAEIRTDLKELYDISGRTYSEHEMLREILNVVNMFRQQHPNFLGLKIIFSAHRRMHLPGLSQRFQTFLKFHQSYPNFLVGFDLVGQEDNGKPLHEFVNLLKELPPTAHYFFHAGETNWYGATTDFNIMDAILLNATRIGHAYALMKHPLLWNAVKNRNIAVEVSPISNQVLHLVWDLRNHPAVFFMSEDIPMIIANDDPGFWNARGLSYDFYYAIMSFASSKAGLKALKKMVWRSLEFSILNEMEKRTASAVLQKTWDNFIDDVLQGKVF